MFRKPVLLVLVVLALFAVACNPGPQATTAPQPAATEAMEDNDNMQEGQDEAMNDNGDEMMEDDEMMNDNGDEMMEDDEMMDNGDEMMEDDEMMNENGDGMMEDEAMNDNGDEMMEDDEMMEEGMMETTTFVIRIENVAPADGLTVLAPGAWELNDHPLAFFTPGEPDRGQGLEALAEDGNPTVLVSTIDGMMAGDMGSFAIGVFDTPVGADAPGPAGPGSAYEFTVEAYPGQYLTFATMFVHSNDWFFSPGPDGIALFDADGNPISGDVSDQIFLWDAGTEVDQPPGEGADQAPRQAGPNTGEAENGVVEMVVEFQDYAIRVTITPQQ